MFDGSGTQTHRYLYGTQVDSVLADENAAGQVLWALADNQGTVRDLVNSSGTVVNHITYDSYGNVKGQSNPAVEFRFGYTGRELDGETGQYYYRARYYDAAVGRFISEDTIGFGAGDANLYRYVFNSPTNFTDPSGNVAWVPIIAAGVIIPIVADLMAPDGVQAPMHPCDNVPGLDNSNQRAVIELGLGLGIDAAPSVARGLGNSLDNLLGGIDNFRPPSGWDPVPVDGMLPEFGRNLSGGFGGYAPGDVTRGAAGGALGELSPPFFESKSRKPDTSFLQPDHNTPQVNLGKYGVEVGQAYLKGDGVVVGGTIHNANIRLKQNGKTNKAWREISGEQTQQQKNLGFPNNTLSSHTEPKALTRVNLKPGDELLLTGQRGPCPTCKGVMNQAARETGATIKYQWRKNGVTETWVANQSKRSKTK